MTLRAKLIAIAYRIETQHDVAKDLLDLAEQVGDGEVREAKALYARHRPLTVTIRGGKVARVQEHVDALKRVDDENEQCNSMYCGHANENPNVCPCEGPCYCKRPGGTCDVSW